MNVIGERYPSIHTLYVAEIQKLFLAIAEQELISKLQKQV